MVSLQTRLLNVYLRTTVKPAMQRIRRMDAGTVAALRGQMNALRPKIAWIPKQVSVKTITDKGMSGERVEAPGCRTDRAILFFHGGSYALCDPIFYRGVAWRLSKTAKVPVYSPDYRLAPEHPFPAALEDALDAWHWLSARFSPEHIVMGGDSAGGGLTLATLFALRDAHEMLPAGAFCLSPWADLRFRGESATTNREIDPFIAMEALTAAAAAYSGDADPSQALLSPVYGDFTGLPPLRLHVSKTEVLLSDATRIAEKASAAGVPVSLTVWDAVPHIFHLCARYLPEGRRVLRDCAIFAKTRLEHGQSREPSRRTDDKPRGDV